MSWTQGIQERETLPVKFLEWADGQGAKRNWGELGCIVWDVTVPNILFLDYGEHGSLRLDLTGTQFAA